MATNVHAGVLHGDILDAPLEVDTMKFVSARAQEIAAISQALDDPKQGNLIFQRLPRHMRRRVMGHNVKRMPRNLREASTQQLLKSSGGPVTKKKTPSRKHRRRPANLLEEYNRRQKLFVWLETHIWHAKRFHMTELWGYRIAHYPNDRSYRACYRATANHCLIQDISYFCCIELTGPVDTLLAGLSQHTNVCSGLTFGARSLMEGSREGDIMFYQSEKYPWQPIGTLSFFWKPTDETSDKSNKRTLWIWAHPAFQQQVVDALAVTFGLHCEPPQETSPCFDSLKRKSDDLSVDASVKKVKVENGEPKRVEELKLAKRNIPFERTPKYFSACRNVEMILLKDTLNRFRLTGPLSQAVLEEALQLVRATDKTLAEDGAVSTLEMGTMNCKEKEPCLTGEASLLNVVQNDGEAHHKYWLALKGAMSPAQMPPRVILYLTVEDPRLSIPDRRTKAVANAQGSSRADNIPTSPPPPHASSIWSSVIRDVVTKSKLTTAEINAMRSKLIVPGILRCNGKPDDLIETSSLEGTVGAKIPLILIQRPGSQESATKRLGFGCGWDVILPAGWAMPFWLAFIFRCARPSGLREAASHEFEAGHCEFLSPDTVAGMEEAVQRGKKLKEAYFRLPPDKRPNFIKLGIACPFYCEWSNLIRDWIESEKLLSGSHSPCELESTPSFFVLRDKKILQEVNEFLLSTWLLIKKKYDGQNKKVLVENILEKLPTFPSQEYSLLPVRVEALQKGVTENMSVICVPLPKDVENLIHGSIEKSLMESPFPDHNHVERQKLKKDHKKLLLRLRRQRVRSKRKQESENEGDVSNHSNNFQQQRQSRSKSSPTADLVTAHNVKMEGLWLPKTDEVGSVKNSGSRPTAGFVNRGNFSFTEARGCGTGYISYLCLRSLIQVWLDNVSTSVGQLCMKSTGFVVLVRSPQNLHYRPAQLHLVL